MKTILTQEQTLQQKMNQSLLQAIHLLQFSGVELIEYIKEITKENPLIEEVNYDHDFTTYKSNGANQMPFGELNPTELSMQEQLKQQLYTLDITEELKPVILFGIDSLDEDGYLDISMADWAGKCDVPIEMADRALSEIQSLEPAGIGARNLSECIYLQLKNTHAHQPYLKELLEEHLDWIADENIDAITEQYQTTEENIENIFKQLKQCEPKPGQLLAINQPEYIIPEAHIFKESGSWNISFYKWNTPAITVNQSYANLTAQDKETADYLSEKTKQINWLKQAISYRANTIELVIKKIVEKQYMFFEHGSFMLQPLTLKEIAGELALNISTISRTISNKYVQTTHGVVPLKFFLQPGIRQTNGKQTAAFAIKQLMVELITHEDKTKPLSDELIKSRLYDEFGIVIARRTVMKYREQLQIPASSKRRK